MSEQYTQEVFGNFAMIGRLQRSFFNSMAEELGLTFSQAEALLAIYKLQPLTFKDLAKHLLQQPAAISQTVEQLVQLGFVGRKISPTDRRVWHISLTAQGTEKAKAFHPYMDERRTLLRETLTHEEIEALVHIQRKLIARIQAEIQRGTHD